MKINNKGLSVVELIVSFVLCILVFVFIIQVVSTVEEIYITLGIKTQLLNKQAIISEQMNNKFVNKNTILIKNCGDNCLTFFYKDNTSEKMRIDKEANNFIFGEDVYNFDGLGFVDELKITLNDDQTYNQEILTINLNIKNSVFDTGKYVIRSFYQYSNGETIYSSTNSNKPEIFLLGPAVTYQFSDDLFIEPGWMVYYPSGKITINASDVKPSPIEFDSDGNGSIRYQGVNEASGVQKTRMIRNYKTIKDHIIGLYQASNNNEIYLYSEMGRYVYKGSNPNNYLAIGSKLFRIISLDIQPKYVLDENDEIVVVDGEKQTEMKYLVKVLSEDYVKDADGNDLLKFNSAQQGDVLYNRSAWFKKICNEEMECYIEKQNMNSIVNDIYLQGLLNTGVGRLQIQNGTFNTGTVASRDYLFASSNVIINDPPYQAKTIYDLEGSDTIVNGTVEPGKWHGNCVEDVCGPNAAIFSLTDVLFASGDDGCKEEIVLNNGVQCSNNNWIWKQKTAGDDNSLVFYRLLTRNTRNNTWILVENHNALSTQNPAESYQTRATLYLDADLYVMGSGTSDNPYTLYTITK